MFQKIQKVQKIDPRNRKVAMSVVSVPRCKGGYWTFYLATRAMRLTQRPVWRTAKVIWKQTGLI